MAKGLLFSGQGAQIVGMGRSLCQHSDRAKALYNEANEVLGWDLKKVCLDGPEEALTETQVCQPALYVHGYAVFSILKERGLLEDVKAACGLSLGELTALAAAEVYDFATGLRLVAERGRLMQAACHSTKGGMAAVIGGTPELVQELCDQFDIEIANFNCPGQIVISGKKEQVLEAVAGSKDAGFKLIKPLQVAGAYHSRLMTSARDAFSKVVRNADFKTPKLAVYTNVTGHRVSDPEEIKECLVNQVVSSVRFESCLRYAASENGIENFIECGPGKVLAGFAKRIEKGWEMTSCQEFEDIPT